MTWPPEIRPLGEQLDVVGVGEVMLLMQAPPPTTLTDAPHLAVDVAGAEYNACAAVARLGGRAALLTRVGEDPAGQRVIRAMSALDLEDQLVAVDSIRPTGVFFRETPGDGSRRVFYYRSGSAASAMDETDGERLRRIGAPRALVLSGLTAALSTGLRRLILALAINAADAGMAVVLDVNLRPGLNNMDDAIVTMQELLPFTDLLVLGDDESGPLLGATTPSEVFSAAAAAGVRETVLKGGERGSWFAGADGNPRHQPTLATEVVDPIGAGDAFLGAYLAARLAGVAPAGATWLGSELAAGVIGSAGDTAGLPDTVTAQRAMVRAAELGRGGDTVNSQ